ncbi:hypothetical protein EVJ58_g7423 [Rhodofomes roseus]|uniref:Uncharacterized protein n=1 Tax=Rhodofomes roseus TaxID=34475 RepID=A0A4Y9Y3V5_9APHY|nr:hypothetical protein EVJ58_g7423 [Rhodofomes roseus]
MLAHVQYKPLNSVGLKERIIMCPFDFKGKPSNEQAWVSILIGWVMPDNKDAPEVLEEEIKLLWAYKAKDLKDTEARHI